LELVAPGGGQWEIGPANSPAVLRGDAGVWCRLVTHRTRTPPARPLTARGVLAEQALTVARAFL
jgi:hypothetical protein